jgi:multidrug resistance protein
LGRKLFVLMVTAFVDMVGLLAVVPLLPYYAVRFGANGLIVGLLVSSYAVAQLIAAPLWGRVSDRHGRKPALIIGLSASAIAYVVFAFADSLWLLFLSRLVQGAGGGTVSVIQAYVADATRPEERAKGLGWLSAATNLGVAIGPVLGSLAARWGTAAPGLAAASLCIINIGFAWAYLTESHTADARAAAGTRIRSSRETLLRVLQHPAEAAPRLILIYTIAMGAFQGMTAVLPLFLAAVHGVTEETIGYFFMYIGAISVVARAFVLGRMVDWLGEAKLSRVGMVLLAAGLALMPLATGWVSLAGAVALIPLGTAFTFPCVTSMLSRVIESHERGLYMGVQQTYGGIARVIAPLAAGFAWDHFVPGVPFWISAALVVGTIFLGIGIERFTQSTSPVPAQASVSAK